MLLQLETPLETVEAAIDLARKFKVRVILNPAPAVPLSPELLTKIDVLTPNAAEAVVLAGYDTALNAEEAADLLISKFDIKHVIITMGKDGALIAGHQNEIIPAYPVQPIDTTGAGDAFNGGLAVALAREDELTHAVKFANAVAALSTTRIGAQLSMPTLDELNTFLDQPLMKKIK
jgi:ribokinase